MKHAKRLLALLLVTLLTFGISVPAMANTPADASVIAVQPADDAFEEVLSLARILVIVVTVAFIALFLVAGGIMVWWFINLVPTANRI
ncbi:MAG: hypothetical protein FWD06_07140 [Oscillospiraceae bacterium]|nr:hypothetical protein [Oscillospiraceae bacterium]